MTTSGFASHRFVVPGRHTSILRHGEARRLGRDLGSHASSSPGTASDIDLAALVKAIAGDERLRACCTAMAKKRALLTFCAAALRASGGVHDQLLTSPTTLKLIASLHRASDEEMAWLPFVIMHPYVLRFGVRARESAQIERAVAIAITYPEAPSLGTRVVSLTGFRRGLVEALLKLVGGPPAGPGARVYGPLGPPPE